MLLRRRIVSAIAAVAFTAFSVIAPMEQTKAAFPIPLVAGAALVFENGALASGYAAAIALMGAAVYAISLPKSGGGEALNIRVNPKASPKTPAGWTASGTAGAAPVPPGTAGSVPTYGVPFYGCSGFSTDQAAANCASAAQIASFGAGASSHGHMSYTETTAGCSVGNPCYVNHHPISGHIPTTPGAIGAACPTGYTLSGATCNLTSASSVPYPADDIAQGKLDGGVVTLDSRDPDNSSPPSEVSIGSGTITVSSTGRRITLQSQPDGTATITTVTGRGDGTSDREVITLSPADSGAANGGRVVTGGIADRVIGEGGSANTGAAPGADSSATQPVPCGLPGSPPCKIDEAGTPTGAGALAGASSTAAAAVAGLEAKVLEQTSKTLPWTWSFSFPTFACAPWAFTFRSWSANVDWCPELSKVRDLWGYALSVITMIYLWRSFTSAFRSV